jgi:hypothetical protein
MLILILLNLKNRLGGGLGLLIVVSLCRQADITAVGEAGKVKPVLILYA